VRDRRRLEHYDAAASSALPLAVGVLAVVTASVSAAGGLATSLPGRAAVVGGAGAAALLLLAACGWLIRRPPPRSWSHPILAGLWILAGAGSALLLYVSRDVPGGGLVLSAGSVLVAASAGAVLLRQPWLSATLAGVGLCWAAAVTVGHLWPRSGVPALALFWAAVLAVIVAESRRRLLDRLAATTERADRVAVQDELTALLNRRGLALVGHQMLATARRSGNAVHCTMVGVDGVSAVLTRPGAPTDRVVVAIGDAIRTSVRSGDVIARWDGGSFCILGPGPGMAPVELEQRVLGRVAEFPPDDLPGRPLRVAAGSAMLAPWDDGDLSSLFEHAMREQRRRQDLVERY
jgi:diguanylate cyclase (GGDEF)-like protein